MWYLILMFIAGFGLGFVVALIAVAIEMTR